MIDLTVVTVVENDAGLLDLMIRSVQKFTDPHPHFIVCDNGGNGDVLDKYRDLPNFDIFSHKPSLQGGSNRHGEGLNAAFERVTSSRFAVIESDCIVLKNGWDDVGFPKYKLLASKKDSASKPGRPIYHACFMVGSTRLLNHNGTIDFRPGKDGNRSNRSYKPHEDVGWQLYDKIKIGVSSGQGVRPLKFVDCKSGEGQYFDSRFQSDEFWLDGTAVAAHFGRGSNIGGKRVRKGFKHPSEQLVEWKKIANKILGDET